MDYTLVIVLVIIVIAAFYYMRQNKSADVAPAAETVGGQLPAEGMKEEKPEQECEGGVCSIKKKVKTE